jgi:hypothetical protein
VKYKFPSKSWPARNWTLVWRGGRAGGRDFLTPGEVEGEVFVVEAAEEGGMGHAESLKVINRDRR